MSLHDLRVGLQPTAAFSLNLFQLIGRGEDAIGQWFVGKRPEPLCRLHLWRIWRQEHQLDPLGQLESTTAVPPSTMCLSGLAPTSSANVARAREKISTLTVGTSRQLVWLLCGCDIRQDIHPFIALGHRGIHRRTLRSPDAPQDWFEANAMLIHRPKLSLCLRVLVLHQCELILQFF